jgi:hypothetical protein
MKAIVLETENNITYFLTAEGDFVKATRIEGDIPGARVILPDDLAARGQAARDSRGGTRDAGYAAPAGSPSRAVSGRRAERRSGSPGRRKSDLKNARRVSRRIVASAACLALIIGGYAFGQQWDKDAFAVYMDINPSVRLEVNSMQHVISADPVNTDGILFLKQTKPKGNIIDAVGGLIDAARDEGVLGREGVGLAFVSEDAASYSKIADAIENVLGREVLLNVVFLTPDDERMALERGVTPVRYMMARSVSETTPGVDFETALSMEESYLYAVYSSGIKAQPEQLPEQ